jgi:hypothetical protein
LYFIECICWLIHWILKVPTEGIIIQFFLNDRTYVYKNHTHTHTFISKTGNISLSSCPCTLQFQQEPCLKTKSSFRCLSQWYKNLGLKYTYRYINIHIHTHCIKILHHKKWRLLIHNLFNMVYEGRPNEEKLAKNYKKFANVKNN